MLDDEIVDGEKFREGEKVATHIHKKLWRASFSKVMDRNAMPRLFKCYPVNDEV